MTMTSYQLSKGTACVILLALGPVRGQSLVQLVNHWLKESGPEWTCSRLKALRTAALQLRAGSTDKTREIYQKNSIAYRRGTLYPRGPYHWVFRTFLEAQQPSVLRRLDAVLRIYTSVRLKSLSRAQLRKTKVSINRPYGGDRKRLRILEHELYEWGKHHRDQVPTIEVPNLRHLKPYSSTYASARVRTSGVFPYRKALTSLLSAVKAPRMVSRELSNGLTSLGIPDIVSMLREDLRSSPWCDSTTTGRIAVIQEAGAKARTVAVPTAYYQWYFEPFHEALMKFIKTFDESCVHDQNKGAYRIQKALSQHRQLWCFDLSSATDRFPLDLQCALLEGLGLGSLATDLREACRNWVSPNGELWHWQCGQPMGLYVSFAIFHLTHLALLQVLSKWHGLRDRVFLVLGDDVVIAHKELARTYYHVLRWLDVEVSPTKSITSSQVAEFAGFIGVVTDKSTCLYRPYKFGKKQRGGFDSPILFLNTMGKAVRKLGSYWSHQLDYFRATRGWRNPDLSPLLPVDQEEGNRAEIMDATRLGNLLSIVHRQIEGTEHFGPGPSIFSQLTEDFVYSRLGLDPLEVLCLILLNQEYHEEETDREIISDPVPTHESELDLDYSLRSDPLIREARARKLHQSAAEEPEDHLVNPNEDSNQDPSTGSSGSLNKLDFRIT